MRTVFPHYEIYLKVQPKTVSLHHSVRKHNERSDINTSRAGLLLSACVNKLIVTLGVRCHSSDTVAPIPGNPKTNIATGASELGRNKEV